MGTFTYTVSGATNAGVNNTNNLFNALVTQPGWSWAEGSGGQSGTVFGLTSSHTIWLAQFDHPTQPFVLLAYATTTSTSSVYFSIAESYNSSTKKVVNQSASGTPPTVAGDDTFYGSTEVNPLIFGFTISNNNVNGVAYTTENGLVLDGTGLYCFTSFTSALSPTLDPKPIGAFAGAGATPGVRFTRIPLYSTLPAPVAWSTSGGFTPWLSNIAAYGPDPFNADVPSGYNFSPIAIRGGQEVGGVLRGSTSDLIYSEGGVVGEEVSIPGVGVYRKLSSNNVWVKVGSA